MTKQEFMNKKATLELKIRNEETRQDNLLAGHPLDEVLARQANKLEDLYQVYHSFVTSYFKKGSLKGEDYERKN